MGAEEATEAPEATRGGPRSAPARGMPRTEAPARHSSRQLFGRRGRLQKVVVVLGAPKSNARAARETRLGLKQQGGRSGRSAKHDNADAVGRRAREQLQTPRPRIKHWPAFSEHSPGTSAFLAHGRRHRVALGVFGHVGTGLCTNDSGGGAGLGRVGRLKSMGDTAVEAVAIARDFAQLGALRCAADADNLWRLLGGGSGARGHSIILKGILAISERGPGADGLTSPGLRKTRGSRKHPEAHLGAGAVVVGDISWWASEESRVLAGIHHECQ